MQIEPKDIYKTVLDTRNLEISMFWQRSNYFLVLSSGLALGFFELEETWFSLFLSIIGLISSYFWFRVCLGGKFWQSRWEHRLGIIEKKYIREGIIPKDPKFILFSADKDTIKDDVQKGLGKNPHKTLHKWIDKYVMEKPSVSFEMIRLSILFVFGWGILIVYSVYALLFRCPATG